MIYMFSGLSLYGITSLTVTAEPGNISCTNESSDGKDLGGSCFLVSQQHKENINTKGKICFIIAYNA
jgi:hypothetical protein